MLLRFTPHLSFSKDGGESSECLVLLLAVMWGYVIHGGNVVYLSSATSSATEWFVVGRRIGFL